MTRTEALKLCEQLQALIPVYPGAGAEAPRAAERIAFRFRTDETSTVYLREKLAGVLTWLEIWCSARKWELYQSPEHLQGLMMSDLGRLKFAVQQAYPGEEP